MGMSQHEVSFFDPKMVTLKGKKVTSFSDIPKQEKKTCFATMAMDSFWERQASTGWKNKNKKKNETNKCKNNNTQ